MKTSSLTLAVLVSLVAGSAWAAREVGTDLSSTDVAGLVDTFKASAAQIKTAPAASKLVDSPAATKVDCRVEVWVPDVVQGGWKLANEAQWSCRPIKKIQEACTGFCCCGCARQGYNFCSSSGSSCTCYD